MGEKKAIQSKGIKKNYIYNLIYEIFTLLTPLITTPYISRVLGADGVGIYSFTNSISQYFILFGNLGIATYGQMVIARNRESREQLSKSFFELWILRLITMLFSFGAYMIMVFYSAEYQEARLVLGLTVLSAAFDLSWLFRGIEDFSKVVIRNFIVKVLMIALIFMCVKDSDDVILYIFLIAMSSFLGNLSFLISLRGVICRVPLRSLNISQHLKPTLTFFIPTIATSVYTLLDKSMIGWMTEGTSQNGYYEQAHRVEQILIVLITSLNTIMRSRMSYLYQQGKLDEMRDRLERSVSFIMMIAIPMTLGLVGIAPVFIPLFLGKGFEESIVLLQIFAFLLVIIGLSNCLNTHFLGPSGRQGKNNYVLIAGAAVNFCCNFVSIPRYGAIGAACASVIAELLILIGYLYLIRDFFKAKRLFKLGWRYWASGITMFVIVHFVGNSVVNNVYALILKISIGVLAYFGILALLKDKFFYESLHIITNQIKTLHDSVRLRKD